MVVSGQEVSALYFRYSTEAGNLLSRPARAEAGDGGEFIFGYLLILSGAPNGRN